MPGEPALEATSAGFPCPRLANWAMPGDAATYTIPGPAAANRNATCYPRSRIPQSSFVSSAVPGTPLKGTSVPEGFEQADQEMLPSWGFELTSHSVQMRPQGAKTDLERGRDLLVAESASEQLEYLHVPRRQLKSALQFRPFLRRE